MVKGGQKERGDSRNGVIGLKERVVGVKKTKYHMFFHIQV